MALYRLPQQTSPPYLIVCNSVPIRQRIAWEGLTEFRAEGSKTPIQGDNWTYWTIGVRMLTKSVFVGPNFSNYSTIGIVRTE